LFPRAGDADDDDRDLPLQKGIPSLHKLSDSTGQMKFDKVAEGALKTSQLDSKVMTMAWTSRVL
jgi:hypothetical protein